MKRLVKVQTPRPGMHVYYRCEEIGGNQKLARVPDPEHDNQKPKTTIEVKGEGGYCLAPPSPAACHKSGPCYSFFGDKDFTMIPTITPEERQILLDSARALNLWQDLNRQPYAATPPRSYSTKGLDRPGDNFNRRADWGDILRPHGWSYAGKGGDGSDQWCRPGKDMGTSASTNFAGSDLLYVFSSNADPFDEGTAYTKFSAYALLEHDGDYEAAALALARQGYGSARKTPKKGRKNPYERYSTYTVRSRRPTR